MFKKKQTVDILKNTLFILKNLNSEIKTNTTLLAANVFRNWIGDFYLS